MTIAIAGTDVGFIGLGVMGRSMAGHLLAAGCRLHVYNRTRSKAEALLARGAIWHDSPGELAPHCQVIITIVGFPPDVEEVYLGTDGLVARAQPGTVLVDMTTSSPALAERIAAAGAERELHCLDAPVSGGDFGAREAALSIMVGGEHAVFAEVEPLLQVMGKRIVYQGPAGAGQHCKMANQIAVAGVMLGVSEALGYAGRAGLDPHTVFESISQGAAGSTLMSKLGPQMLTGDFAPGFYVKHFVKDMGIAADEAERCGVDLPGLRAALAQYRRAEESGHGDDGTQALYALYRPE